MAGEMICIKRSEQGRVPGRERVVSAKKEKNEQRLASFAVKGSGSDKVRTTLNKRPSYLLGSAALSLTCS
jgi:hypothetical protein